MFPSDRAQQEATQDSRREPGSEKFLETFRPVALPALAAAVHISASAARAARDKLAARRSAPMIHEDEPTA